MAQQQFCGWAIKSISGKHTKYATAQGTVGLQVRMAVREGYEYIAVSHKMAKQVVDVFVSNRTACMVPQGCFNAGWSFPTPMGLVNTLHFYRLAQ